MMAGLTVPPTTEPRSLRAGEAPGPPVGERYEDRGLIAEGGMGEVRRVWDRHLERTVAMKVLRTELSARSDLVRRMMEEAQTTARLQHPGIVPVHELARLPDGRVYYTMPEVRGETFLDRIRSTWRPSPSEPQRRRLLAEFRLACDAVAYAHAAGVIHRDLKPQNVMVGAHGEVLVLDWGIATSRGAALEAMLGTPAWMAPETLDGSALRATLAMDVYALGCILYAALTGHAPYRGHGTTAVRAVLAGPPPPVRSLAGGTADPELVGLCERAMARAPEQRPADAQVLADGLGAWLDGSVRRENARRMVEAALAEAAAVEETHRRAEALEAQAASALDELERSAPAEHRYAAWATEDRGTELRVQADLAALQIEQALEGALALAPDLPEAHLALAERHREAHREAEARADLRAATVQLARMRAHVEAIAPGQPGRAQLARYLRGDGALTLHTDPPRARARLYALRPVNRRLCAVLERDLGTTPLDRTALPMGSWLVELTHPGRATVRYPVAVERGEHWDGTPPGQRRPEPIQLPPPLPPAECYVPAGWTWVGGDPAALGSVPRTRVWVDGFVIRRHPVTNGEWIEFLDALVAEGRDEEALRHVPREKGGALGELGAPIYGRDPDGRFFLRADADGDLWLPDWPVINVDWHGAMAFAAWEAARTGLPWRLLAEFEREKAGRGVDSRFYPWGNTFDPSWACVRDSVAGRPQPPRVGAYPMDESVYGVQGLAGGARDWCLDGFVGSTPTPPNRVVIPRPDPVAPAVRIDRGGFWLGNARDARLADRHHHESTHRSAEVTLRLARSVG